MTRLEEVRRAVEMAAWCKRIEHNWQAPPDTAWVAEMWCNAIGQTVLGYGPDAWTAVQAAHALSYMAEQGRHQPF